MSLGSTLRQDYQRCHFWVKAERVHACIERIDSSLGGTCHVATECQLPNSHNFRPAFASTGENPERAPRVGPAGGSA